MKSRHQSRTARGASRTLQPVPVIVDGLLKQGRYKEALSQSLNAFRSDPTTEHRQTTERAYLRYVADLVRSGALTAATEVAKRFLEFGCSGVESLEALLPLLAAIKLTTESANLIEKIQSPEKITALKANMADQAVRLGRDQDWPFPEIRPGAAAVTAAMEAFDAGEEERGLAQLHEISRHSPFAEWRLFLRGLAAQRRGDKDTVEANWSRLDANRRPAKVVAKIRGLSTDSAAPGGGGGKSLEQIERSLYGGSVTGLLRSVRQDLVADELERFFEQMPVLVRRLASVDSKFPQRLTEILLRDVVQVANELEHDSARRFVKDFIKVAQPVSYDPKFDRLQALVPQSGGGFDGTLKHWRNFRNGVRDAAPFSPADRRRLEAMILRHMSEGWATKAQLPEELLELGVDSNAATTPDKCWTEARAVLEESIELDPTARKSYQALWDLVLKTPDTGPEALVTVAERTLKAFPGDLDSLRFLIDHYYVTEDSQRGKEYVEELRRRVPLEVEGLRSEIRVRYLLARDAALSGDFETGRSHLAAAEQLWDEIDRGFAPLARRAIFEFRAGEIARAEALVKEAFNASKAKLPVILELAINAARYDLPVMLCARFDRELQVESRKKVTAESAAHSAMAMHAVLTFRRGYPTRQTHVDATAAHVLRSSRVKFSQDQFEAIGEFLRIAGTPDKDQLKILHRAQREFPWAPSLVVQEIEMERAKPPGKWNVNKLITLVNHAIVLADRSTEKEDKEVLLPELRDMLEALRFIQLKNSKMGNPGRKGRSMDVLESMFENFMGGFEDSASGYDPFGFDDDEDDESAAGNFGSPFPRPARKKAPPRKGR